MFDAHEMRADGYQTFNFQQRDAFSAKYQYQVSSDTSLSAFSSIMHLKSNTPNQKGRRARRSSSSATTFLMTDDPASPLYYKYNFLLDSTRFRVLRRADAAGPRLVDRQQDLHDAVLQQAELQRYDVDFDDERHRQTEQLPEVRQQPAGDLRVERRRFRTGLWSEYASNRSLSDASDPRTWIDAALPKLPRDVRHHHAAAVRRILLAGAAESQHHAGIKYATTDRTSPSSPTTARPSAPERRRVGQ